MKALKSYVKDMDSRAIPLFLAQVSETKETGSISGEYTISLYEVLARVHGVKIVSQIDRIMTTVIKTLSATTVSFPLQQACSKVIPAIARYGIEPTTPEDEKRRIMHSLCNPLVDALLGTQETLTSGAALCLKALVESDNWRYASNEMVNKVCQNVAVALEDQSTQSNSHMALVMALSKRNALIVEPYARLLIQTGLCILNAGTQECNSQKRMSAIQMINFMMKCLDPRSIFSMLDLIILEMDKSQSDQIAFVKGAAFEALQTAKKISSDQALKRSNFSKRDHTRRGNFSSPESQSLGSFIEYDSVVESPYDRRSVNRKLWNQGNGMVNVSLKDGLFSELTHGSSINNTSTEYGKDHAGEFSGFSSISQGNGLPRSCTPSPQVLFH
ncbi:Protein SINE1 [Linum perenne]